MSVPEVVQLGRDLLWTALLLSLPALGVSLLVGLVVSIFQAVTSIQEQTLTFVPRLLAVGVAVLITLPWAVQVAMHFTVRMLWRATEVAG